MFDAGWKGGREENSSQTLQVPWGEIDNVEHPSLACLSVTNDTNDCVFNMPAKALCPNTYLVARRLQNCECSRSPARAPQKLFFFFAKL